MRSFNPLTRRHPGAQKARVNVSSFFSDVRGVVAIEFAILAVPFLGLLAAVMESGLMHFYNSQLQSATVNASRVLLSHSAPAGLTNQEFINKYICTWKLQGLVNSGTLPKLFDCDKIIVDISSAGNWDSANTGDDFYNNYDAASQIALPGEGQIAVLRVAYPLPAFLNILVIGADASITTIHPGQIQRGNVWTHMLIGVNALRVEP